MEPIADCIRCAAGWLGDDVNPWLLDALMRLLLPTLVLLAEAYAASGDLDAIEFLAQRRAAASDLEMSRSHWN